MEIEVFNETGEKLDKELEELKELLINIAHDENLDNIIYNVIIVGNDKIRELNREFRNKDCETDVISFALEDDDTFNRSDIRILGDIYISLDKTRGQAIEYNHSFKRELSFLAVHGFYHLLGYDHLNQEEEDIMFRKQEEALTRYGINR